MFAMRNSDSDFVTSCLELPIEARYFPTAFFPRPPIYVCPRIPHWRGKRTENIIKLSYKVYTKKRGKKEKTPLFSTSSYDICARRLPRYLDPSPSPGGKDGGSAGSFGTVDPVQRPQSLFSSTGFKKMEDPRLG